MQSKMGAAGGHPPGCRGRMDRCPLEREMLRSGMVLACGTVPCLSLLPGQVPPDLAEGREGLVLPNPRPYCGTLLAGKL